MGDSIDAREAAFLGAVLTMKLRTRSTDLQLRNIFREVMAHEGPLTSGSSCVQSAVRRESSDHHFASM